MTAALFKHTTDTARRAALLLPGKADGAAERLLDEVSLQPSEEEVEIARLKNEVASLSERIRTLQGEWDRKLDEAKAAARDQAAREHVRNDADMLEAIETCLQEARKTFSEELTRGVGDLALGLASAAVRRLADLKHDEEEWLGRVIAHRVDQLAAGSLVAIHVSSAGDSDAIAAALTDRVPQGVELKLDPSLPPSTARLVLRLGEIEVSPAQGTARLVAALEQAGGGNG